jgi:hypothetical protein
LPQIVKNAEWQAFATLENARQGAVKDMEAIVKALHKASGFIRNPFARSGAGFYGITHA